jgi:hypothetical protein
VALQQKVALLDQMGELEQTVAQLKERNSFLVDAMSGNGKYAINKDDIRTMKEAKGLIKAYSAKVKLMKGRMKELQRDVLLAKKTAQRDEDLRAMELGNNGFMVRDGKVTIAEAGPSHKNVNIDVTFVK